MIITEQKHELETWIFSTDNLFRGNIQSLGLQCIRASEKAQQNPNLATLDSFDIILFLFLLCYGINKNNHYKIL